MKILHNKKENCFAHYMNGEMFDTTIPHVSPDTATIDALSDYIKYFEGNDLPQNFEDYDTSDVVIFNTSILNKLNELFGIEITNSDENILFTFKLPNGKQFTHNVITGVNTDL